MFKLFLVDEVSSTTERDKAIAICSSSSSSMTVLLSCENNVFWGGVRLPGNEGVWSGEGLGVGEDEELDHLLGPSNSDCRHFCKSKKKFFLRNHDNSGLQ